MNNPMSQMMDDFVALSVFGVSLSEPVEIHMTPNVGQRGYCVAVTQCSRFLGTVNSESGEIAFESGEPSKEEREKVVSDTIDLVVMVKRYIVTDGKNPGIICRRIRRSSQMPYLTPGWSITRFEMVRGPEEIVGFCGICEE